MGEPYKYCEAADVLPNEPPCQRLAQWSISGLVGQTEGEDVLLCNFHAEPFTAPNATSKP
jgi:hypothetical protein